MAVARDCLGDSGSRPGEQRVPLRSNDWRNPYLSGFVLVYQSVLDGKPILSHSPFTREDPRLSDFAVALCGPEHRYGPLDFREPHEEALVTDPRNGFQEIARVRLPSQCDAAVYRNTRKLH